MFSVIFYTIEGLSLIYFFFKIYKMTFVKKINKRISWLIPLAIVLTYLLLSIINIVIFSVVLIHFTIFMGIADLVFYFINKNKENKIWKYNIYSILFTVIYLSISLFLGLKVFETTYNVRTEKVESSLRIAQITDSHIGSTFSGEGLYDYIIEIGKKDIDLLVITGDFVDDDTKYIDLVKACSAFKEINTTYGVYFVYGNHDKGYSNYRDFDKNTLVLELEKNDVVILEDDYVEIGDDFYLIGRKDKSTKNRKSMDELVSKLDDNRYKILLDHQPNDYSNEKGKVDMVLSGHTHGGNILPANLVIYGLNDQTYGMKNIDNTTFIVSSGISNWRIPFNNCAIQEYVIININK